MKTLLEIRAELKPGSAFKRMHEGIIRPSSEEVVPEYCLICMREKYEYINPNTGRISLLNCECEKYLSMLSKYAVDCADEQCLADAKNEISRLTELKYQNKHRIEHAEK